MAPSQKMKAPEATRPQRLLLILILLLAFGLRLYRLDAQSLWNDEGTSVALAQRNLATIARQAAHDIHPPLYYFLLRGWIKLVGTSELAVRLLSVMIALLTVALTYRLATFLTSVATGLLAAALSAISPFQIYYAQEARMYALAALLALFSMISFRRLMAILVDEELKGRRAVRRRGGYCALHVVSSLFALHSHYFVGTILLAQNVAVLHWLLRSARRCQRPGAMRKRVLIHWSLDQVITLALFLPWLSLVYETLLGWPSVSQSFSLATLVGRVLRLLPLGITVAPTPSATFKGMLLALPLIVAALPLWRHEERVEHRAGLNPLALQAFYLLTPILAIYLASLRKPMYDPKFLLLATPAYHLLQAQGLERISQGARRLGRWLPTLVAFLLVGGVAALCASSLANLYWNPAYARDDYRGIVSYVENHATPDDAILINAPSQIETVDYYYDGALPMYPLPLERPPDREGVEAELVQIANLHPHLFCIFWATEESDPEGVVEGWLDTHGYKTMDRWYGNLRLAIYALPQEEGEGERVETRVSFGDQIELQGYRVQTSTVAGGDVLQLSLYWRALTPIEERYKVFTHLVDGLGHIVAQRDSEPGGGSLPTPSWAPGETISDNYGLQAPIGTIPGEYRLRVGLYALSDGRRLPITAGQAVGQTALELGEITVTLSDQAPSREMLDYRSEADIDLGGVRLLGYSLHRLGFAHAPDTPIRPGDTLELILFWQREEGDPASEFTLAFQQSGGQVAWQTTRQVAGGVYPPAGWREGQLVRDIHHVVLPADLDVQKYQLAIGSGQAEYRRMTSLSLQPR